MNWERGAACEGAPGVAPPTEHREEEEEEELVCTLILECYAGLISEVHYAHSARHNARRPAGGCRAVTALQGASTRGKFPNVVDFEPELADL